RLYAADDAVLNQAPPERRSPRNDFLADRLATVTEMDPHNPELHHPTALLEREQDLASVAVRVLPAGQNAHVYQVAVKGFHSDRHVVFMDQEFEIRRWDFIGRYELILGQVAGRREQRNQGS